MNAMIPNPDIPQRMPDLPEETRRFLASVRPEELPNLELWVTMREDERKAMEYIVKNFSKEDFEIINESLENLRTMKRAGKFAFWLFGFIGAGAAAAVYVKGWIWR
ncbi:MAG: hypothetical protein PW791_09320 [Neorhizobium sp.]|jgi:hypothetical protein|nr:hypothetical protein [Neorhizobium sp.]